MAKSHSFWVIIDGAVPTAFRAKNREDLLPTLTQLKRTQPNVVLMWFERGRVWESPTAARAALEARRSQPRSRDRKPEWRPGGDHRDPRAKYQLSRDEKRARFKKRNDFERRSGPGRPPGGDRQVKRDGRPPFDSRPPFARPASRPRQYSDTADRRPRGPSTGRPSGDGGSWRSSKPPRPSSKGSSSGPPKTPWKPRPRRPGEKPPRKRREED